MSYELCASMMCARYDNLAREVKELDEGGIDIFHLDIMDGNFVDNYGMGYQDMEFIRSATNKRLEAHLMVQNPKNYINTMKKLGMDIVYIHPESDMDSATTLEKIKKEGMTPGIAINPGTSLLYVEDLFNWVERVLVLCVNPGHSGRQYVPYMGNKVKKLLEFGKQYNFDVVWDGACTYEKIEEFVPLGVKGFVLGTSVLFNKEEGYGDILKRIKKTIK